MKIVWVFAVSLAVLCSVSVSSTIEVNKNAFIEFKIKYNKVYKSDEEEKFRMMIFIENKLGNQKDHIDADKLSHELESEVESYKDEDFEDFMRTFKKKYEIEDEYTFRKKIFKERVKTIAEHNDRYSNGLETYEMGVNEFSDMLYSELDSTILGFIPNDSDDGFSYEFLPPSNVNISSQVDWRAKGAVTPVKNQGQCGSCWSFAATGALEGQNYKKTKKLVNLSEQNLVDCARSSYGSNGCNGGQMEGAFRYIKDNKGINSQSSYPYKARQDNCHFDRSHVAATDSGSVVLSSGSEEKLRAAVATVGPVAVAISVCKTFYQYRGGVYFDNNCYNKELGHAVLVVGYGTDPKGGDYWLIKNSWSTTWGEKGYLKLARNKKNNCGIGKYGTYPLV
ncbi:hypothetical protein ACFFRR_003609 [Megaselia abdita]